MIALVSSKPSHIRAKLSALSTQSANHETPAADGQPVMAGQHGFVRAREAAGS